MTAVISLRFVTVVGFMAVALCVAPQHAVRAQTPAQSPEVLTITTPSGQSIAFLTKSPSTARWPVVVLVSLRNRGLARGLADEGVASLEVDGTADERTIAQWVAQIRNNGQFPTVTVFGDGSSTANAVIAARAARADGIVVSEAAGEAKAEFALLVATKLEMPQESVVDLIKRIAEFAKGVPVLGRRGTAAARPLTDRRSPRQALLTTVGAARIGIEWGSPQKRGREIWGALVKWNEIWMPGADEATTLTTNVPITIGTLTVPAGDHTFYTIPGADRFQLVVSNDVGQFHTVHDATKELGRVDMTSGTRSDPVEGLTFFIESRENGAVLKLAWDSREFSVPISVPSAATTTR